MDGDETAATVINDTAELVNSDRDTHDDDAEWIEQKIATDD